jgi:plastocyanin domain-containing protein
MKYLIGVIATSISLSAVSFAETKSAKVQEIQLQVTEKGFEPSSINVKPGTPVVLKVTRKTDSTCATAIQIPSKKIKKDLPLDKTVSIDLGKLEKGEIRFACGMNMVSGQIIVN